MRLFSLLVLALVLVLPAPARAQSVKLADLVGTWVATTRPRERPFWSDSRPDTLIFRADSTSNWSKGKSIVFEVIQSGLKEEKTQVIRSGSKIRSYY